jgi:hypothetical protein
LWLLESPTFESLLIFSDWLDSSVTFTPSYCSTSDTLLGAAALMPQLSWDHSGLGGLLFLSFPKENQL